jgi:hypothetical protein
MAISALLETYLSLEERLLTLDARQDPSAEAVRDAMDTLWYRLSEKDREYLDSRTVIGDGDVEGGPEPGDAVWCRLDLEAGEALLLMAPPAGPPSNHDRPVAKGSGTFPREAA